MTREELNKAICKSMDYLFKSEEVIEKAVQKLAKAKGFKNYKLFHCAYAGDLSLIVSIAKMGDAAELTLEEMFDLSKEEIINRLVDDSYTYNEEYLKSLLK